jgi:hypothetical protein
MALPVTYVAGQVLEAQELNDSFIYVEPGSKLITAATFTNVSTVSMAASTFTSTYNEYQVFFTLTAASAAGAIGIRVNNAGTPRTAANYAYEWVFRQSNGFSSGSNAASQTSANFAATNTTPQFRATFTVSDPVSASATTEIYGYISARNPADTTLQSSGAFASRYAVTEANDGLTFFPASGTFSGYYRVYGMRQS